MVLTVFAWPRPPRPRVPTASLGHRLKPRRRASCPTLRLPQRQRAAAGRAMRPPSARGTVMGMRGVDEHGDAGMEAGVPVHHTMSGGIAASMGHHDHVGIVAAPPRRSPGRERCRSEDGARWRTSTLGHRGRATRTASSALRRPPGERDGRGHACDHCAWLLADV